LNGGIPNDAALVVRPQSPAIDGLPNVADRRLSTLPERKPCEPYSCPGREKSTSEELSARINSRQRMYCYHLGVAYSTNGEDAKARAALERTLKLSSDFPCAREVKQLLSALVY